MNIYIDESGSINNRSNGSKYFVIAMIRVTDKKGLERAYKRFVSSNLETLKALDADKVDVKSGKSLKPGGKMFLNDKFQELKGSKFDRNMKIRFLEFFSRKEYFEIYYVKIANQKLTNSFCSNTARVFNYTVKLAMSHFLEKGFFPNEDCFLQLDDRNEKTEAKYFLENYLNTELTLSGVYSKRIIVKYFDSSNNKFIQIADVFANLLYSHLQTGNYGQEFEALKNANILKYIFDFPRENS